jgi:hypothetical protein
MGGLFALISRVLHNWFTGPGNDHYELGRFLWFLAVLAAIIYPGLAMWWKNQPFDVQAFCFGLAAILAAGGFGVAQKDVAKGKIEGAK